ncbi:amidase [Dendrothele bispora CBS 962.96]|uniref:amidase n=1 Tax=Dendrothele bispora (strain CBS 962.96) TaxID=1314807 RepID=A0A4S8MSB2_DENBC|nr:amidase [Dendrothele bispora CBS 962.96]
MSLNPIWPQAALDAVAQRDACIPEDLRLPASFLAKYPPGSDVTSAAAESGLMTDKELQITNPSNDATSILAAIKNKTVTSLEVMTAFMKRAAIGHQLLCCLAQIFFEEGLVRARELDEYYEKTGELIGPLHGLPISIKEHMNVKGKNATGGFSGDLGKLVATENGHLIQILWNAGAVFYCKTNQPQSLMHIETFSFWGQTLNPYNTKLTSGGSSGGCSALISFGGSPLSLGSDIGGSLRVPAASCGIYTLKPTTGRLPSESYPDVAPVAGNDAILPTGGPIARSSRDMELFFATVYSTQPWTEDPRLTPLPWYYHTPKWTGSGGKIRLGVMWHDGVVYPQPPIRRALKALVDALRKTDAFEISDYEPKMHADLVSTAHRLYFTDGAACVRRRAAGEPLLHLTEWVTTLPEVKDHTTHEHWALHLDRDKLRKMYADHWNSQNVDAVLCPAGPGPAQALQTSKYWGYTSAWNFVDYPAAVFPTGLSADPTLDPKDEKREPWSKYDAHSIACYEPETFKNAPLSLQIVSRRNVDEAALMVLKEVEKVLPLKN